MENTIVFIQNCIICACDKFIIINFQGQGVMDVMLDHEVLERLQFLRSLEDGWNDGDGLKMSRVALDTAEVLLQLFNLHGVRIPAIGPTEDGEIRFQWTKTLTLLAIGETHIIYDIVYNGKVESQTFEATRLENLVTELSILNGVDVAFVCNI